MATSCTIIVYHFEAIEFLRACVRKIREYKHPEIVQHIIITEQSGHECYNKVVADFGNDSDITVVKMQALWSGYAIDYVFRNINITTDYVCCIEPDVFPIHKNWLYVSIKLIEEFDFKFVGGLLCISKPTDTIFCNQKPFYWLSQYLRVGKTKDYKELSLQGGFTRFHNRTMVDVPMTWGNNDWAEWAKNDYPNRGSDDATVAHWWEDNYRENDKFSFGVTHIMGNPPEPGYGRIIDGLIFHFGFHRTSVGVEYAMGNKYNEWKRKIESGCDNNLINEMLSAAHPTSMTGIEDRSMWDGKLKKCVPIPDTITTRINELKNY